VTRPETLRERRRRETAEHIAEKALQMFRERGYDATTMQAVAEASGIAPRTLFHYFATKDAVLRHWLSTDFADELRPTLLAEATDQSPLAAVRNALILLVGKHETERSRAVDEVLNSTEALRASKLATFVEWELIIYGALREMWPAPGRKPELRAVATASMGALRLALEQRRNDARTERSSRRSGSAAEQLVRRIGQQFDLLSELDLARAHSSA
jgi:AcrR family transcriptional regulator